MKEYIERDLLKNMIQRDINECCEKDMTSDYMKGYHNGLTTAYAMTIFMYAADVVERVRGEWVRFNGDSWKCSVCGEENEYAYCEWTHKFTDRFCPNCGCQMVDEVKK